MIGHHQLDLVIFFRDPLSCHPHACDVQALIRICDTTSTMSATNPASARGLLEYLKFCQPTPKAELLHKNHDSEAVRLYKRSQQQVIKAVSEVESVESEDA